MNDTGNNTPNDQQLRDAMNEALDKANDEIKDRDDYSSRWSRAPISQASDFCAEVNEFINN